MWHCVADACVADTDYKEVVGGIPLWASPIVEVAFGAPRHVPPVLCVHLPTYVHVLGTLKKSGLTGGNLALLAARNLVSFLNSDVLSVDRIGLCRE